MSGLYGAPGDSSGGEGEKGGYVAYVVMGGVGIVVCAIVVVCVMVVLAVTSAGDQDPRATEQRAAALRKLPDYWTVRRGDTFVRIADRTGLMVDELQTFNPRVNPSEIEAGQRLKLRAKVAPPEPEPPGPRWVTVHTGDSLSSIAAKRGKTVARLRRLNPKLKPTALQPGDRVRLR